MALNMQKNSVTIKVRQYMDRHKIQCYLKHSKMADEVDNLVEFMFIISYRLLLLKLVSPIFQQIFIFHQMIAFQKIWKIFLLHLKNSFHSWDIQIFVFPSSPLFLPVSHYFRAWSKINLKVYNIINCLNKN